MSEKGFKSLLVFSIIFNIYLYIAPIPYDFSSTIHLFNNPDVNECLSQRNVDEVPSANSASCYSSTIHSSPFYSNEFHPLQNPRFSLSSSPFTSVHSTSLSSILSSPPSSQSSVISSFSSLSSPHSTSFSSDSPSSSVTSGFHLPPSTLPKCNSSYFESVSTQSNSKSSTYNIKPSESCNPDAYYTSSSSSSSSNIPDSFFSRSNPSTSLSAPLFPISHSLDIDSYKIFSSLPASSLFSLSLNPVSLEKNNYQFTPPQFTSKFPSSNFHSEIISSEKSISDNLQTQDSLSLFTEDLGYSSLLSSDHKNKNRCSIHKSVHDIPLPPFPPPPKFNSNSLDVGGELVDNIMPSSLVTTLSDFHLNDNLKNSIKISPELPNFNEFVNNNSNSPNSLLISSQNTTYPNISDFKPFFSNENIPYHLSPGSISCSSYQTFQTSSIPSLIPPFLTTSLSFSPYTPSLFDNPLSAYQLSSPFPSSLHSTSPIVPDFSSCSSQAAVSPFYSSGRSTSEIPFSNSISTNSSSLIPLPTSLSTSGINTEEHLAVFVKSIHVATKTDPNFQIPAITEFNQKLVFFFFFLYLLFILNFIIRMKLHNYLMFH
jgi:hypothetical protein